jgi:hypothetical protein
MHIVGMHPGAWIKADQLKNESVMEGYSVKLFQ